MECTCTGITDKEYDGAVVIPSHWNDVPLTLIGHEAFMNCKLSSIHLPASVRVIDYYAFLGCPNLSTVTFDEGSQLRTVRSSAFSGCNGFLMKIIIPASVTKSDSFPIHGCDDLLFVTYLGTKEAWLNMGIYIYFPVHCIDGVVTPNSKA